MRRTKVEQREESFAGCKRDVTVAIDIGCASSRPHEQGIRKTGVV